MSILGKTAKTLSAAATLLSATALFGGLAALHAEPLKIGFVVTMSGPGAVIGQDMVAGFKIGMKHEAGLFEPATYKVPKWVGQLVDTFGKVPPAPPRIRRGGRGYSFTGESRT